MGIPYDRYIHLIFFAILLGAFPPSFVAGQSRWQDIRAFHPYCIQMFRSCVGTTIDGGMVNADVAVGFCGNKMAICSFSQNLSWPWGTDIDRPANPTGVVLPGRLLLYRQALADANAKFVGINDWETIKAFLPDCQVEFRNCVAALGGETIDAAIGICGNGMSVCTIRSGLWPYGDDISQYNIRSYTRQLPLYQAVFNRLRTVQIQTWQGNNEFSNTCKQLMSQCVAATGLTTDTVIGVCGNLMSICTFENPNWPTSDDGNPAYLEPYEDRWFRYASALSASSFNFSANRWQEVNRFSSHCRKIFFQCVENSGGRFRDDSVGICGHRLSICTFEDNIWPTSNDAQANLLLEPYQTRLPLYRMQFQHLRNGSNSLRWYPRIIPEYFYIRHISGSCVRPQSDTTVPATTAPIVLHKGCNDESFSFQFTSNGSLMHKASGKCLHPSGKLLIPTNGTSMIIADGCDEPRVQFNYSMDGYLRHKESGRCLNGQGGSLQPVDNTPLVLSDPCSSHHEFSLIPIPTSDPIYISACETHVALLSCPMGQRIANALMQYGRWDNGLCPHVTVSSNTRPQFATRQLNDANGKQSASVIVSNESFGSDVYPSVYKHGLISYSCDPA